MIYISLLKYLHHKFDVSNKHTEEFDCVYNFYIDFVQIRVKIDSK